MWIQPQDPPSFSQLQRPHWEADSSHSLSVHGTESVVHVSSEAHQADPITPLLQSLSVHGGSFPGHRSPFNSLLAHPCVSLASWLFPPVGGPWGAHRVHALFLLLAPTPLYPGPFSDPPTHLQLSAGHFYLHVPQASKFNRPKSKSCYFKPPSAGSSSTDQPPKLEVWGSGLILSPPTAPAQHKL